MANHPSTAAGRCSFRPRSGSPALLCAACPSLQSEGAGYHWHGHSQAPKTTGGTPPVTSHAGSARAGPQHAGSTFALMLHLFWDKTGCEYQVQATWCNYNHLENIDRIKSCGDPLSPGCRSTRDLTTAANAEPGAEPQPQSGHRRAQGCCIQHAAAAHTKGQVWPLGYR